MARLTLGDRLNTLVNDENLDSGSRKFAGNLLTYYLRKKSLTRGRRDWVDKLELRAHEQAEEAAEFAAASPVGIPAEFVTIRELILSAEGEGAWSLGFVDSIIAQAKRGRPLSEKQRSVWNNVKEQYTGSWSEEYRTTYQEKAKQVAAFYRASKLPYWENMIGDILSLEEYVPRRQHFLKMFNNRYAQRVLEQTGTTPVFTARQSVQLRKNQTTRTKYTRYLGKKAFVLAVGDVIEAVKGGRGYTVLFAGNSRPMVIQERYLMKVR